jgi:hypothetical protein
MSQVLHMIKDIGDSILAYSLQVFAARLSESMYVMRNYRK